jgi:hypothetical protein
MPSTTFPYISMLGYTEELEAKEILEIYDDLTYDRYLNSDDIHVILNNTFREIGETQKNSLKSHWKARKLATSPADFEFYIYNPEETFEMTGTTGRYVGIYLEPGVSFDRSGKCTWNVSMPVLLLRAE